jgi:hypothetical protein
MADGLIQENMAQPESENLSPEGVRQGMDIPPDLQEGFDRVVLAGMKVMFDEKTHGMVLEQLEGPGPMAQKLGQGMAGLMLMLFKESNQTMPPQLLIPCGIELLMQAVDFVKRGGLGKVTDKEVGEAMQIMIDVILEKFGQSPDKIASLVDQYDTSKVDAAAQQMGA